ncbi:MAG: DoxX family protein [Candidatus Binataceae bacterium]
MAKPGRLAAIARIALGLIFLVLGLNYFLAMFAMPPLPPRAGAFYGALGATRYMLPLIMGTEVIGGALLLSGWMTPLALVILAPVIVNIIGFHLFLDPAGIAPGIVVTALELFLAWQYRAAFAPLFDWGGAT